MPMCLKFTNTSFNRLLPGCWYVDNPWCSSDGWKRSFFTLQILYTSPASLNRSNSGHALLSPVNPVHHTSRNCHKQEHSKQNRTPATMQQIRATNVCNLNGKQRQHIMSKDTPKRCHQGLVCTSFLLRLCQCLLGTTVSTVTTTWCRHAPAAHATKQCRLTAMSWSFRTVATWVKRSRALRSECVEFRF